MNWKLLNHMWKILQIFQCGSLGNKFSGIMKAKQVLIYMYLSEPDQNMARLVFLTIYFKKCCTKAQGQTYINIKLNFVSQVWFWKKNALRVHYSQSHVFVCYLDCPNILYYRNLVRILQWSHILYFQARVLSWCF